MRNHHPRGHDLLVAQFDRGSVIAHIGRINLGHELFLGFGLQQRRVTLDQLLGYLRLSLADRTGANLVRITFSAEVVDDLQVETITAFSRPLVRVRIPLFLRVKAPKSWLVFGYDVGIKYFSQNT